MRWRSLTLAVALGCIVASAGCVPWRHHAAQSANPQSGPTMLTVNNQGFLDMDIYVVQDGGQRIRLGTATGSSTTTMRIPNDLIFGPTQLRFRADPIGGTRSSFSTAITVLPGDTVQMTIPPA